MSWICGVEEAGRGPVIGPMVMACCWVREEDERLLVEAGCKDSKLLTPQQREGTLERLEALKKQGKIGFNLLVLSPKEIDGAVQGENDNLNLLELRTSVQLINNGLQEEAIAKALIDCPTKNTEKYANDIRKLLDKEITVIAEHKADVTYPVVSAASIIAKVTRDKEVEKLKKKTGINLGSGYPADPLTQAFLREHYKKKEYAGLFRKSWASYRALVEAAKQPSLFHFQTESGKEQVREAQHAKELKRFEILKEHGFDFQPPTSQYEILRMRGNGDTIILYTTGKLVVQGAKKKATEALLARLGLR